VGLRVGVGVAVRVDWAAVSSPLDPSLQPAEMMTAAVKMMPAVLLITDH
jgi:hypothetical protein